MKNELIMRCPKCHSRKMNIILTKKGFDIDRAMTGAVLGGIIGGHSIGLFALMGIEGGDKKSYCQCEICGNVW